MATDWIQIAVPVPGVGDRAYVLSMHINGPIGFGSTIPANIYSNPCQPMPDYPYPYPNGFSLLERQCHYNTADSWYTNMPMEGIFPQVGQWVRLEHMDINNPTVSYGPTWVTCYKVIDIIDESTFNNDTCVECYNQGVAGTCSDLGGPYPDPAGCRYNDSIINPGPWTPQFPGASGIPPVPWAISFPQPYPAGPFITTIVNTCAECWPSVPPPFTPNMIVNCCDPNEKYQLTAYAINVVQVLGVSTYIESFHAELGIGGTSTGWKCWHVEQHLTPLGPFINTILFTPVAPLPPIPPYTVYSDCADIIAMNISGNYPCCSPIASWDCDASTNTCSDPGTGLGAYNSLAACQAVCPIPTWDCNTTTNICSDPGTGLGTYNSLAACQAICGAVIASWDCNTTTNICSDPGNGLGVYSSLASCQTICANTTPNTQTGWCNCNW